MFVQIVAVILTLENIATAKITRRRTVVRKGVRILKVILQQQAEYYLGTTIEASEWDNIKPCAESKLMRIIKSEGDKNGERRKSYYRAQLIAEMIRSRRFSQFTLDLIKFDRDTDEQLGIKKE